MKDMMLDLETLGTRSTSVITQIGACMFDRKTGQIGKKMCVNIDVGTSLMAGLTVDPETIQWWKEQEEHTWIHSPALLVSALNLFSQFCETAKPSAVWSHATFDVPILDNAFRSQGLRLPFHYRAARDIRTLVDLSGISEKEMKRQAEQSKYSKTHDALEDCCYQVEYCVYCLNKLKEKA